MIKVNGLCKVYGETQILHGLTFDVKPGHLVGLLGPNGSGKSTTLDILGGLLGPTSGSVTLCGHDIVSDSLEARKKISYLRDNPGLYLENEVQGFIEYMGALRGLNQSERRRAANRVIEECEIGDVRHRIIGHLSKGYRQRTALAASMVHQPEVMILDEPTDGLDPTQILLFRKLVKNLSKERAVILSSHILSEVQAVCSDVIIIQKGHIAFQGNLQQMGDQTPHYTLKSDSSSEDLLNWCQQQTEIDSCSLKEKGWFRLTFKNQTLEGSSDKIVSHFLEKFLQKGFLLHEFIGEKKSLESVYLETLSFDASQGASSPNNKTQMEQTHQMSENQNPSSFLKKNSLGVKNEKRN